MLVKEVISSNFVKIDQNRSISELIGHLMNSDERAALVFDGTKLVGVSTKDFLIRTKLDPTKVKVKRTVQKIPILNGSEDIKEAARLLYTTNSPLLPVVQRKALVGVVKCLDIIKQIQTDKSVNEIMTPEPIVLKELDKLGTAVHIMREKNVGRLPIIDNKKRLIGIVGIRDIIDKFYLFNQGSSDRNGWKNSKAGGFQDKVNFNEYPVVNLASADVVYTKPTAKVSEVISLMIRNDLSCIILVENDKPVGIVTDRDILKLFLNNVAY